MPEQSSDGIIRIRRYRETDVEQVYQAVKESIPELYPWFTWCHKNYSMQKAEGFIRDQSRWWQLGEVYNFAITDVKSGAYFGGCLINDINRSHRFANLAYWIRSSCTGRGIATASARLVAKFGFKTLGLNRVEIVVAKDNPASIRVAEKTGAKQEGEIRNRITVREKVHDAILFSLIPGDI